MRAHQCVGIFTIRQKYEADRAPGGIFYESSGSRRAEAAKQAEIQAKDDALAQSVDTSEVLKLANRKDTAQQWLKDNGYGNYDKDDASDVLRSKVADIEKSQLQQGIKDGIIYTDDRREVYVDGVMVGNPKSADTAREMLDRELKKKTEAAPAPSVPDSGVSGSTGMEVRSLPNGTEYFVDSNGQFAGLK